jgi:thiol-disulfide isomerase/thioredoxin
MLVRSKRLARALAATVALGAACHCAPDRAALPVAAPIAAPETSVYRALLARYVDDAGHIDYARWKSTSADLGALEGYVAELLATPPHRHAALYPTDAARLSYWANLYNALVLREVLRRWPLASVDDVPSAGGGFAGNGRGFFHDLRFDVGGRSMSLWDVETEVVRSRFHDPRVYFALSCAARSCPLLPREPFDASTLERQLESATRAFVNDRGNVDVDHRVGIVIVSSMLAWYRTDFERFVREQSLHPAPTLVDFLLLYASTDLARDLERARRERYGEEIGRYDWALNAASPPLPSVATKRREVTWSSVGVGEPIVDVELPTLDGGSWRPSTARGSVLVLHFWASWCRPCLASFPQLAALEVAHEKQGLVIMGVAEDQRRGPVEAYVAVHRPGLATVLDIDHRAQEPPLGVMVLPTVLLVDRSGVVRARLEGYDEQSVGTLVAAVEELLAR